MALNFDWGMFAQAAEAKRRAQEQKNQDILSLGQGIGSLGQGLGAIGESEKKKNQTAQWQNTINQALMDPNLPQDKKYSLRMLAPFINQQTAGQLLPSLMKSQKPQSVFRPFPGQMSAEGEPLVIDESTGEVKSSGIKAKSTSKGAASDLGEVSWEKATPDEQNLAKALYNGDVRPYDLGYRERSKAVALANQYANREGKDPYRSFGGDVKAGTAKAFATGKPGLNVLSLNTALGHAKSALDAYKNVQNTDTRLLNVPINKARTMTNDPNVIKLGVTLNALQGELATVFKGTAGTDQEIGKWMTYLSQDLTPTQAVGAIQQVNELLNSRLSALEQMRSQGTSNRPSTGPLLSPHAKQLTTQFQKMGQTGQSGLTPSEQAEFDALSKRFGGR